MRWPPATALAGPPVRKAEVVIQRHMPCVYILKSDKTEKTYVGSSKEDFPDSRIRRHNTRGTISTRSGRPWRLIHQEYYNDYKSARKRELFLKSGRGRELVKQLTKK